MTPKEVLLKAADLLETSGWIQFQHAANKLGKCVPPESLDACSFCMRGAMLHVAAQDGNLFQDTELIMEAALHHMQVGFWNDHPRRTKEEAITKLREVAESCD